jgi:hypothetical protein
MHHSQIAILSAEASGAAVANSYGIPLTIVQIEPTNYESVLTPLLSTVRANERDTVSNRVMSVTNASVVVFIAI